MARVAAAFSIEGVTHEFGAWFYSQDRLGIRVTAEAISWAPKALGLSKRPDVLYSLAPGGNGAVPSTSPPHQVMRRAPRWSRA